MNQTSQEDLLYLMRFVDNQIEESICNVLEDSLDDPQHSAVTTANMILCYISVMRALQRALPFTDIKGYFLHNQFSIEDWEKFEKSRQKESSYYIGKQWKPEDRKTGGQGDGSVVP